MTITANDPDRTSWLHVDKNSDFPIQNIPFGVFLTRDDIITIGTRIGDTAIDLGALHQLGYFDGIPLTDANSLYSEPYNILNTRLGYNKEIVENLYISSDFGINNIFDVNYAQSVLINAVGFGGSEPRYYYPGNDRNFYISLGLRYQL